VHNDLPAAQRFAAAWAADHAELYDDELQYVLALTAPRQMAEDNFMMGNRLL
jgi:hypothetical protein